MNKLGSGCSVYRTKFNILSMKERPTAWQQINGKYSRCILGSSCRKVCSLEKIKCCIDKRLRRIEELREFCNFLEATSDISFDGYRTTA